VSRDEAVNVIWVILESLCRACGVAEEYKKDAVKKYIT